MRSPFHNRELKHRDASRILTDAGRSADAARLTARRRPAPTISLRPLSSDPLDQPFEPLREVRVPGPLEAGSVGLEYRPVGDP